MCKILDIHFIQDGVDQLGMSENSHNNGKYYLRIFLKRPFQTFLFLCVLRGKIS
jgi:hypothetical protein